MYSLPSLITEETLQAWTLANGVVFSMDAQPEDCTTPAESLSFPGSEEVAKRIVQRAKSNVWEWCLVEVTATHTGSGLQAKAYLGACSYASADDFMSDCYYLDLRSEAAQDLVDVCKRMKAALA